MTVGCAVQIVEHCGLNEFKVKKEALNKIYGDERVSKLLLVVLCIAGAARKGKSFMLNFFLDYLIHKEKSPHKPWILNETTNLNGFEFQDGEDRMTLGIWAWNHIFVIENGDGKKIAVSLIDSQGTFDKHTSYEDCSSIFAMTSMFSSVMCFNVFTDLQEDKLNDFTAFIEHGKLIVQNLGGSGKLFQSLVFIIRDFQVLKYLKEENGGQNYVEKQLGDVQNNDLQKVRDNLKESYEQMFGFIFPYPGAKVAQEKTSKISEMEQMFVEKAKKMVETLFSNLQIKKIGSSQVLCKDMVEYIQLCVKCFNDHPKFAPRAVQTVNREFMINLEVKRALETYESLMDQIFVSHETGYERQEMVKDISDKNCTTIENEIADRIKDQSICFEVLEKFKEGIKYAFPKYQEKNALLVKNENTRLDNIKQKQESEKQQQKILEMEKQRKEDEKKREEENRKHAEETAKLQRELATEQARPQPTPPPPTVQPPPTVIYVNQPPTPNKKKPKGIKKVVRKLGF